MVEFQAFRSDEGEYRWRLVENGRVVRIRPGRIHLPPMPARQRKSVEAALDGVLARMMRDGEPRAVKA